MTVRIVVVADTHVPRRARQLPIALMNALSQADIIVHLGDFTSSAVLETLRGLAPVHAVHGNNDDADLVEVLPGKARVVIGGKSFALVHGHLGGGTAVQAARKVSDVDAVLFGHSHRSYSQIEAGRLIFNPGSPTDGRWTKRRTFGVVEVDDILRPSIVNLP